MNTQTEKTTCQICGRAIKASKGVIAHHGYIRPGDGWQTNSCYGARHLPYESSCDAIPDFINVLEKHVQAVEKKLNEFVANPPAKLNAVVATKFSNKIYADVDRPENFKVSDAERAVSFGQKYILEYSHRLHAMRSEIKSVNAQIEYLKNRLSKWNAV